MRARDVVGMTWRTLVAHRLRSALTMLGIAIGIASVILLTSIGEGTRQYILSEFTQFGTNIIAVNPGKTMTTGQPGALGGTIRRLTTDDAEALRRVPGVEKVVPISFGMARVEGAGRGRSVMIYGANSELPDVLKMHVGAGRYLPETVEGDGHVLRFGSFVDNLLERPLRQIPLLALQPYLSFHRPEHRAVFAEDIPPAPVGLFEHVPAAFSRMDAVSRISEVNELCLGPDSERIGG